MMEANHEEIVAGAAAVAGRRALLHLVAGVGEREAAARAVSAAGGEGAVARTHCSIGGPRNQGVMDAMTALRQTVTVLMHRGFVVLGAEFGWRNARVTIEACGRCRDLGGALVKRRTVPGEFRERTWCASIHGVQVQWTSRWPL